MTLRKVTGGELLAGAAGAVLIGVLFAPWYGGAGGFASAAPLAALLALTAAAGLALLATTAWQRSQAIPVALESSTALLAALMLLVVLAVDLARDDTGWGAWAGLAAVASVLAGCWRALRTPERR